MRVTLLREIYTQFPLAFRQGQVKMLIPPLLGDSGQYKVIGRRIKLVLGRQVKPGHSDSVRQMPGLFNLAPINRCELHPPVRDNLAWYGITTMCLEGCDMTEITPTRKPLAQIALAVLNTGHPGPMPRGTAKMGAHRRFTRRYRSFFSRFVLFL